MAGLDHHGVFSSEEKSAQPPPVPTRRQSGGLDLAVANRRRCQCTARQLSREASAAQVIVLRNDDDARLLCTSDTHVRRRRLGRAAFVRAGAAAGSLAEVDRRKARCRDRVRRGHRDSDGPPLLRVDGVALPRHARAINVREPQVPPGRHVGLAMGRWRRCARSTGL